MLYFMFVSQEELEMIFMCEKSKETWDILERTYDRTKTVKNSKLQMLTSRLEEIRMKLFEFYAKLSDIVRKVMRFLPKRFHPKVTVIDEARILTLFKIEELVSSL